MPPLRGGESEFITGNNTSYKSSVIEALDTTLKEHYWEYFLQEELKAKGIKFLSAPSIIVTHKKEFGFFYFLSQRFHYSRSFSAMRKRKSSISKQVAYLLYTPFLPIHLILRIAQNVWQKKRNYKEFLLTLPLLLAFMCSYALGEFVGQVLGSGDSLSKVE
jgi:GT2 family glycosyltransferase